MRRIVTPARPPPLASCLAPLPAIAALLAVALAGCGSIATRESPAPVARAPDTATAPSRPATPRGGGYYLNDGPGDNPPPNLDQVPDAVPKREPLHHGAMRPYSVMGQDYIPMTQLAPYKARGIATWYGRRYHGQRTSSGEIYDMYQMTAAHTTLPIPSFARVTNLATHRSAVVRINDRGPFHSDRLIDLSYTAAYKLGLLGGGSALVEVEAILPDAGTPITPTVAASPAPAATPVADAAASAAPPPTAPIAARLPAEPVAGSPASSEEGPAERGAGTRLRDATAESAPAPPSDGAPRDATPLTPAATPEPVATTRVVAVTAERKGMFLQLGAFGSRDNADNYLARLRAQVGWLAPALHVYPQDGLFRVHAGPYADQAEARTAADRISQALGIKTMLLVR